MMNLRQLVLKGELTYLDLGYLIAHLLEIAGGNANRDAMIGQVRPTTLKKSLHTLQRLNILDTNGELSEDKKAEISQTFVKLLSNFDGFPPNLDTSMTKLKQNSNKTSDFCPSFDEEIQNLNVSQQNYDKTQTKVSTFVEENGTEYSNAGFEYINWDDLPAPPFDAELPINIEKLDEKESENSLQTILDDIVQNLKERKERKEKERTKEKEKKEKKETSNIISFNSFSNSDPLIENNNTNTERIIDNNNKKYNKDDHAKFAHSEKRPNLASDEVLEKIKGKILDLPDRTILGAKACEFDTNLPPSQRVRFDFKKSKFVGLYEGDIQTLCSEFNISEKTLLNELTKMAKWLNSQKEKKGVSPVKIYWRFIKNWLKKVEENNHILV